MEWNYQKECFCWFFVVFCFFWVISDLPVICFYKLLFPDHIITFIFPFLLDKDWKVKFELQNHIYVSLKSREKFHCTLFLFSLCMTFCWMSNKKFINKISYFFLCFQIFLYTYSVLNLCKCFINKKKYVFGVNVRWWLFEYEVNANFGLYGDWHGTFSPTFCFCLSCWLEYMHCLFSCL